MTSFLDVTIDPGPRRLRMETLTRLRWFAISGQTLAIVISAGFIGLEVPIIACAIVVALPVFLNIYLRGRFPSSIRLTQRQALSLLLFDIAQLSALLYLTGGLENPFALLLMVSVLVSAAALPIRTTILVGGIVIAVATFLAIYHFPLPWFPGEDLNLPFVYKVGIWIGIVSGLSYMAIYTWRVSQENRELADAFTTTELVLAREQHLSALDGMAAAAAHALGTPLSTIAVAARELEKTTPEDHPSFDDIRLIKAQSDRCRDVLRQLTSLEFDADVMAFGAVELPTLMRELASPYDGSGVAIEIDYQAEEGMPVPSTARNPAIVYSLGNLVENAIEFAEDEVLLRGRSTTTDVLLEIIDDGPGFPSEVKDRLGEPYVTSRRTSQKPKGSPEGAGLGLGFFIAKTILERSGAKLEFFNRNRPESGAVVRILWPSDAFATAVVDNQISDLP